MKQLIIAICLLVFERTSEASVRVFDCESRDPIQTIRCISRKTGVPAGLLYGIWAKESAKLRNGWRTHNQAADWFLARDLIRPGGKCLIEYPHKQARCFEHWRALRAMCAQKQNGMPICNANEVYTSYAFAMGPTQHMPAEILKWHEGAWRWSEDATDGNNDGVVDPNNLADAVAMTAVQINRYREVRGSDGTWRWAVNRYYGTQHAAYFDGQWERGRRGTRRYRFGVREHWIAWCRDIGCRGDRVQYAVLDEPKHE